MEISRRAGRFALLALRILPRRFAWPEHGRLGLDPRGSTLICVSVRGRRQVAWFEN